MYRLTVCLVLLSSLAFSQTAKPGSTSAPQTANPGAESSKPQSSSTLPVIPQDVPPSGAVITLQGLCPGTSGPATGTDCKTIITREQFEKLVGTLNPDMPKNSQQMLAEQYAKAMVLQSLAERQHIPETQHFKDMMDYMRTQILASEVVTQAKDKAKPTSAEVQEYYTKHQPDYEQAALKRLFIPKSKPSLKEGAKQPTDAELKLDADKMRTRAAAGEDFDKLQKEIYDSTGIKTPPPPTSIPNWRRTMVPPTQAAIFDLKPGEVSQPIVQPEGIYIYKLESKKTVPLNEVRAEIEQTLQNEKLRNTLESVFNSVKPQLNENYFGTQNAPKPAASSSPAPRIKQ
jgi:parvulin-like peptidyl-prolyl isomerase